MSHDYVHLCWCVLYQATDRPELAAQFIMSGSHSVELWEYVDCCTGRGAWMVGGFPYVTLNNQWSCDSETERADTAGPQAWLCRKAEAANILTVIKGNKPCHAAIRPNSCQPISFDINGRIYKSAVMENVFYSLCYVFIVFTVSLKKCLIQDGGLSVSPLRSFKLFSFIVTICFNPI